MAMSDGVFDSEALRLMQAALDEAWATLPRHRALRSRPGAPCDRRPVGTS